MTKINVLQAALTQGRKQTPLGEAAGRAQPATAAPESPRAPSRAGKENVSAWLTPDYQMSLRLIHARTGRKKQELIAEALNDLFAKYDVPQVRED